MNKTVSVNDDEIERLDAMDVCPDHSCCPRAFCTCQDCDAARFMNGEPLRGE